MAGYADFAEIPRGRYRAILADPPWNFKTRSQKNQTKGQKYRTMTLADICALPVAELADPKGCALFLWGTAPMLPQALAVMEAWGFSYRSAGAWAKRSKRNNTWAFGTGYLFRSAMEPYLLGVRGRPKPMAKNVRNLVVEPVRENSRKPEAIYTDVARLFDGPRLDLFSRQERPGWDAFGDELGKFPALMDLEAVAA